MLELNSLALACPKFPVWSSTVPLCSVVTGLSIPPYSELPWASAGHCSVSFILPWATSGGDSWKSCPHLCPFLSIYPACLNPSHQQSVRSGSIYLFTCGCEPNHLRGLQWWLPCPKDLIRFLLVLSCCSSTDFLVSFYLSWSYLLNLIVNSSFFLSFFKNWFWRGRERGRDI